MDTLQGLLQANGDQHRKIFYLKMDVEGAELAVLPEWIQSGALARVDQLAMELHLEGIHTDQR